MYLTRPNTVIGFHGCDKAVRDKIVTGEEEMKLSHNDYDWLGHGAYFWEFNETRAIDYALELQSRPERCKTKVESPAALGAILQLGYCLDLLDSFFLDMLRVAYEQFVVIQEISGYKLPENKTVSGGTDLLLRKLDCAVIESLHQFNKEMGKPDFDTVRGVFFEGEDLYPNAGFKRKNHIQICVRNPNSIKGFFIPRKKNTAFNAV